MDLQAPASLTGPPYLTARVAWNVSNLGAGPAVGYWNDVLYLSQNPWLDASAAYVAQGSSPGPLEPGENYWSTNRVTLPVTESGNYYLILDVNAYDSLVEISTANNQAVFPFYFTATPADLAPISLVAPTNLTCPPRPYVPVAWGVTNQGLGAANPQWSDAVYISTNATLDASATPIYNDWEWSSLAPGGSYWRTNNLRLPVTQSGTYYLFLNVDRFNSLHQTETNNDVISTAITLNVQPPDFAALAFQVPAAVTGPPNPQVSIQYAVTNLGPTDAIAEPYWYDSIYLSTDPQLDPNDREICQLYQWQALPAGAGYQRNLELNIPVVTNGTWYLIFKTDSYSVLSDPNPANNIIAVPVAFTIVPCDLAPLARVPSELTGPPYPEITLVFGSTNLGPGQATAYWYDAVYFSTTPSPNSASMIASASSYQGLAPGAFYLQTNTVRLPVRQDGTYYLIFRSDSSSELYESDKSNNVVVAPLTVHIQRPDLAPVALQLPNVLTSPPNPEITFVWGVTNQGLGAAIGHYDWTDDLYYSTNAVLDSSAQWLNYYNYYWERGPIAPGGSYWRTNSVRLPIVRSGTYYFFLKVDNSDYLLESDESNNVLVASANFIIEPPDLAPIVSQIPAEFIGPPNPAITLVWAVTNLGPGLARPRWADAVYLSADPVLDYNDSSLLNWQEIYHGPIPPGQSEWRTNVVRAPMTQAGPYYLIFKADSSASIYEENRSNNIAVVPINFIVKPPDLLPELQVPSLITGPPNPPATLIWHITNQGLGPAEPQWNSWYDMLYLSWTPEGGNFSTLLASEGQEGPIAPGTGYWRTNTVRLPVTRSGNRYFVLKADSYNAVAESDEGNNTVAVPVHFDILQPDLAPLSFLPPPTVTGAPYPTVTFVSAVTNQGAGPAEGEWYDRIYLATNNVFDETSIEIGSFCKRTTVPAGGTYWRTNQLQVPVRQSGTYYFFFVTDINRSVYEADFNNNLVSVPVNFSIAPPDLAALSLTAPPVVTGLPRPSVTVSWVVTNLGPGVAQGSWLDSVYLSRSPVLNDASLLANSYKYGPLAPGESYTGSAKFSTSVLESGTYYLIFKTAVSDELHEANLGNNTIAVPVTFQITPPDLVPFAIQVPPELTGPINPSLTVVWGVTNQGTGSTPLEPWWSWYDEFYLATAAQPSGLLPVGTFRWNQPLGPGESAWATNTLKLPVAESGTYYLVVHVNRNQDVFESCFTNNEFWVPITLHLQPPDLAPVLFRAPAEVTGGFNPLVKFTWGVTNQGPEAARPSYQWIDRIFLSSDPVLDWTDMGFLANTETTPLAAGSAYWRSQTVRVPVNESGTYYAILSIDDSQDLFDLNYSNNTAVVPIHFNIQPPDLAPLAWNIPTHIEGSSFPQVTLAWGVTNQGVGRADSYESGNWLDRVYLSETPDISWNTPSIVQYDTWGPLGAGESVGRTNTVQLPVRKSGTYYFIFAADDGSQVAESCETNNWLFRPVTISVAQPDLVPISLEAPPVVRGSPYPPITLVYGVTNCGPGAAVVQEGYGPWSDIVWLSRTNVLDGTATELTWGAGLSPLPPGGSYWRTNNVEVPIWTSGSYYLILKVHDGYHYFEELDYSNNHAVIGPISFEIQPTDVAPILSRVPASFSGAPYSELTLVWAITNQGPGTVQVPWQPRVHWSPTPVFDSQTWIDSVLQTNVLQPGECCWVTNRVHPPVTTNGTYYVFLDANPWNDLQETNTANDVLMVPINYTRALPDLAPVALLAPPTVVGPPRPRIDVAWGITNQGAASAEMIPWWSSGWSDVLYLSKTTNILDGLWVGSWDETNSIAPGGSYWRTNRVQLETVDSGQYYLILVANYSSIYAAGVAETDLSNNVAVVPITLDLRAPDLAALAFQAPSEVYGEPNPEVTFIWAVTNRGPGAAFPVQYSPSYWRPLGDAILVSSTPAIGTYYWFDTPVCGYWERTQPLLPGASEWHTNTMRVPVSESGSYYFIFKTDPAGSVFELDENNNTIALPVTFHLSPPADLSLSRLIVPRTVSGAGNPAVPVAWQVVNEGIGPLTGAWADRFTLSGMSFYETPVATFWATNALWPGDSYWRTNLLILPVTESGDYRLTLRTGQEWGSPFDLDPGNNQTTVPITFNLSGPPAVRITDPHLYDTSAFVMSVYGALGTNYQLQASSDLVNWTRVLDFACTYNPTSVYDRDAGQFARRFYRVALLTEPAPLRLDFAPWARSGSWTNSPTWLMLDGPPGANYRIEASSDLTTWSPIQILRADLMPMYIPDDQPVSDRRFYRAVRE